MGKTEYKVIGGKLIRVQLIKNAHIIEHVKITGDFFLYPEVCIEELETALVNMPLDEKCLLEFIRTYLEKRGGSLLGASPEDLARCIMMAGE